MICDKCGCDHNLTCCPRCAGMGTHTGFYTSTIAAPDHRAERRRDLLTVATQLTAADMISSATYDCATYRYDQLIQQAKELIAAVDAEIAKEQTI